MGRGFGITAAVPHDVVRQLAIDVERAGYSSFWVNDMPQADGLATLAEAAAVTSTLVLGVGVIPLDRRPAETIASDVAALGLPLDRLLLGVGGGGSHAALARVRSGAAALTDLVGARVVVGALGPKMSALAGEVADGVLLNWMTPAYAAEAGHDVAAAAARSGRAGPLLMSYVRCGFLPAAERRLREELQRYDGLAYFADHERRMGVSAYASSVLRDDADALQRSIVAYESVLDETIVRAITPDDRYDTIATLLEACAPPVG